MPQSVWQFHATDPLLGSGLGIKPELSAIAEILKVVCRKKLVEKSTMLRAESKSLPNKRQCVAIVVRRLPRLWARRRLGSDTSRVVGSTTHITRG